MGGLRWIVRRLLLIVDLAAARRVACRAAASWPSLALLGVLLLGFGNGGVVWAEQTRAERAHGGARRDVAVLDGRHRRADAATASALTRCAACSARRRLRRHRAAGVAGDSRRRGGRAVPRRRARDADRVRRLGGRIDATRGAADAATRRRERARRPRRSRCCSAGSCCSLPDALDRRMAAARVQRAHGGALGYLIVVRRDRRVLGLRVRAEAPAGGDGVALRVRQSDDRRGAGHLILDEPLNARLAVAAAIVLAGWRWSGVTAQALAQWQAEDGYRSMADPEPQP